MSGERPFWIGLSLLGGSYVALVVAMIAADAAFVSPADLAGVFRSPEIRYATILTLASSTASAAASLAVGIPLGYLLARNSFPGKRWVDALVDVPVVLPPLVVGISLLILFRAVPGVAYSVPAVILAQFAVAAAFAVRTLRVTFEEISPRAEQVAMTLGCTRAQAFRKVALREARRGILAAATLAWARSLGEFGPVLVFAGATRGRTEVLSTTVFLELSIGELDRAVAVSLFMVLVSLGVIVLVRGLGAERAFARGMRP